MENKTLVSDDASLYKERATSPHIFEKLPQKDDQHSEKHEDEVAEKRTLSQKIPKRYILCFLVFLGFLLMNCERSCLSVAIVAMSSKKKTKVDGKWVTKVVQ